MNNPQDLAELAERVQQAYALGGEEGQRYIQELMTEKVEVRHTPPAPSDGVVDRDVLVSQQNDGFATMQASVPEFRLEGKVSVEDDRLVVTKFFTGRQADGSEIHTISRAAYRIEDGRIVGADSTGTVVVDSFRDAGVDVNFS